MNESDFAMAVIELMAQPKEEGYDAPGNLVMNERPVPVHEEIDALIHGAREKGFVKLSDQLLIIWNKLVDLDEQILLESASAQMAEVDKEIELELA